MFIDYIALLLINMTAGLIILAAFLWRGFGSPGEQGWAPGLAAVGLVATAAGLHMTLTWPIPRLDQVNLAFANVAYGELSVMLGALFLGGALAVAMRWSLVPLGIYAVVAGAAAVVVGMRIIHLGLTQSPWMSGIGFILTGIGGMMTLAIALTPRSQPLRVAGAALLVLAAAIWALTGYAAYWGHLAKFSAK